MCLAIYKPKQRRISVKRLKDAYQANPDGYGILYRWDSVKGIGFNSFLDHYFKHEEKDLVIHFRTASSGSIGVENCHPIYVNDHLAFVENGNLFQYSDYFGWSDKRTDIQRFNDEVLKKLKDPFLYCRKVRNALEEYCKSNFTKMIFMDATGRVEIVNEKSGEWVDGVWYSNGGIDGYVGYGYSGAYYYKAGDVRHKGGLITVNQFKDKETWKRCPSCLGWFKGDCEDCKTWENLLRWRIELS